MNKKLTTEHIADELGRSAFFSPPRAAEPTRPPESAPTTASPAPTAEPAPASARFAGVDAPPARTPVDPNGRVPARRTIARCSFEIFQDQMDWLRQLSLADKLAGGKGSMSEMVREALDRYREAHESAEE